MINRLKMRQEARIKKLDKYRILSLLKGVLRKEIYLVYFGGSIAYDSFSGDTSDIDLIVFADIEKDMIHTQIGEFDIFIYNKKLFLNRFAGYYDIPLYNKSFIDDKCSLDTTLIYVNEKYLKEYEEYKNFDLSKVLKTFLSNFYEYYMFYFIDTTYLGKKFYHVIRMKGQMEHYKKTGIFDTTIDEFYKSEMLDFKANFENEKLKKPYYEKISKYLDEIYEFKEGLKDG